MVKLGAFLKRRETNMLKLRILWKIFMIKLTKKRILSWKKTWKMKTVLESFLLLHPEMITSQAFSFIVKSVGTFVVIPAQIFLNPGDLLQLIMNLMRIKHTVLFYRLKNLMLVKASGKSFKCFYIWNIRRW